MTMDAMDNYIRSIGFLVDRSYMPRIKKYKITLSKDDYRKTYYIEYPRSNDDKQKAISNMIDDMNKCIEFKRMSEAPCGLTGNLTDGYRYTPDNLSIEIHIPKLELPGYSKMVNIKKWVN